MNKKGSIAIESAIAMTIVMVFVTSLISITCVYRTDINMQRAVEASCEKFAVYTPLSVTTSDVIFTMVNAAPDISNASDTANNLAGLGSLVAGVDGISGNGITELILDGTLGQVMRDDIAYEYEQRAGSSLLFKPDSISVVYNLNPIHEILEVEVTYKTTSIIGTRTRTIYSVIPFYGDFSLLINEDDSAVSMEDPWNKDNFSRGDYFRDEYGANLPKTFPVIDSFNDGEAESIMSVDLTAPTYNSGDSAAYNKICEEIDSLAGFNGADVVIDGRRYVVDGANITSRTLSLVVPDNSDESVLFDVYSAVRYGYSQGVDVIVYRDGQSTRYSSN